MWSGSNTIIQSKLKLSGEIFLPRVDQLHQLDIFENFIQCSPQVSDTINTMAEVTSTIIFKMKCF